MSYILEALKKADRERAAGHVPDLETVHRHESAPRKSYRWLWLLAALFVSNGVLVALLATRHDAGHDGDQVAPRATPRELVTATPAPVHPQAPAEIAPPVRLPPAKAARVVPRIPARPPDAVAPRPAPTVRPATGQGAPAAAPAAAEAGVPVAAALPPPVPSPARSPVTARAPSPARSPVTAPATAPVSGKIPEWDELSLDFRSRFSMPRMDVHVYDPDPQRRFVLINLQKFREGDRLPNGAVLEKILPDGIELSYQGRRFHYGK